MLEITVSSGERFPITYTDDSRNSIFDQNSFETILREEFSVTRSATIIYADALGQKTFTSDYFLDKVDYFLNHRRMLGILSGRQTAFSKMLLARNDCDFLTVTHDNREDLLSVITHRLKTNVVRSHL